MRHQAVTAEPLDTIRINITTTVTLITISELTL